MLSGERRGGSRHSGECRGSGVLSGARGKTTARQQSVYSGRDKKTLYTVAKQKQLPSAGLDIMCAARPPRALCEYQLLIIYYTVPA